MRVITPRIGGFEGNTRIGEDACHKTAQRRLRENTRKGKEIHTLDGNTKSILFNLIDTYIRDAKARRAYAT